MLQSLSLFRAFQEKSLFMVKLVKDIVAIPFTFQGISTAINEEDATYVEG